MHARIAASLLLTGWFACSAAADWLRLSWPPVLATAQEIRSLSPEDASAAKPVKLTGIVTYVNPQVNDLYMQDATAGIYVLPTQQASGLKVGDRIELEGTTDAGEFSPSVSARTIVRIGRDQLPDPMPFDVSIEDSRWMDSQWIQSWVVVRGLRIEAQSIRMDVYNSHGTGVVIVPGVELAAAARAFKDHTVVVRGVCAATFADRMVSGSPRILVADLSQIRALPAVNKGKPDKAPCMIDHLLRFGPAPHPVARQATITGVVTAAPFSGLIIMQDENAAALVSMNAGRGDIPIGTLVDATGLMRIEGRRLMLTQARVTVQHPAKLPLPINSNGAELLSGSRDLLLIRLEGVVESARMVPGGMAVALVDGAVHFEAFCPGTPEQYRERLEPGALVAVVGVATQFGPDARPGAGPCVYLPNAEALALIKSPPPPPATTVATWWTADRVTWLCGGFLAVTLLGGGWTLMLRLQVRRATREVQRQFEEKAKLERQLRQAAKLEAVGRLAGGIAHDFNNLLTVINGCAELLADEISPMGGRVAELAADIRHAGERAAALTGQLLTFSRKRDVVVAAIDINEVVGDAVRLLDRVLGEHILIHTHLAADLPRVRGEGSLLHQVVMNLAVNAKDAMPSGGTLTLVTAKLTEPVVVPRTASGGSPIAFRHFVRLTVTDTGVGMTQEVKARIFEPFFTTKDVGAGTGLGLATVYGIIQTVRGQIRVDSELGRGTTFHIDFRIHGDPTSDSDLVLTGTPSLPVRRLMGSTALAGWTVLIVEDNAMVRDLLHSCLTADGATVLAAETPAHAPARVVRLPQPRRHHGDGRGDARNERPPPRRPRARRTSLDAGRLHVRLHDRRSVARRRPRQPGRVHPEAVHAGAPHPAPAWHPQTLG